MKNVNLLLPDLKEVAPTAKQKKTGSSRLGPIVVTIVIIPVLALLLFGVFTLVKRHQGTLKKDYRRVRPSSQQIDSKTLIPQLPEATQSPAAETAQSPAIETAQSPAIETAQSPAIETEFLAYVLESGNYSQKDEAVTLMKELVVLGFSPQLEVVSSRPQKWYYVYVGEFDEKEAAEAMARKLAFDKFDRFVTTTDDGKYTVRVGSFQVAQHAYTTEASLTKRGYPTQVETEEKMVDVYLVRIGEFSSAEEAREKQSFLEEKNLSNIQLKPSPTEDE